MSNPDDLTSQSSDNGRAPWGEYRRLVLNELTRLSKEVSELDRKIDRAAEDRRNEIATAAQNMRDAFTAMHDDILTLKTRSGVFGAAGGVIGGAICTVAATALIHWLHLL